MTLIDKAEALRIVMEECYKDREMKLATRIEERIAALPARGVGVKDFDVEIVRGNTGGNLSLYFNDHRVAGSKPWGGGTTIHSFRVQGDEVKSSGIFATIRNFQTVPADKDFLTTAAPAPTDAAHVNETPKSEHDAGNVLTVPDLVEAGPPFFFDRYINGVRMAEDVCVERETTLEGAIHVAARIAAKGPNGEPPVLVYRHTETAALIALATAQAAQIEGMIDADTVQKMLDSAQPIMAEACRGYEETIADLRTDVATLRAMQAEREAALQELRFHVDDAVKAWNAHEAAEAKLAEVEKERERQQFRGDNHWETLRSIRDIATSTGDIARIVQWVNDAGSGYTETAETTLSAEMDRRLAAEATVASLQAQVEAMRGALEQIAWSNDSKWQADCARAALEGKA